MVPKINIFIIGHNQQYREDDKRSEIDEAQKSPSNSYAQKCTFAMATNHLWPSPTSIQGQGATIISMQIGSHKQTQQKLNRDLLSAVQKRRKPCSSMAFVRKNYQKTRAIISTVYGPRALSSESIATPLTPNSQSGKEIAAISGESEIIPLSRSNTEKNLVNQWHS